jgi:hypothetical protein
VTIRIEAALDHAREPQIVLDDEKPHTTSIGRRA